MDVRSIILNGGPGNRGLSGSALQERLGWFAEYGVREIWLLDPKTRHHEIYELVAPPAADPGYSLTELLQAKKADAVEMTRYGERFFTSLGCWVRGSLSANSIPEP